MFAIHHIKRVRAVESSYEDASYLTLKFEGEDLGGPLEIELVLYFHTPVKGQIRGLAQAINEAEAYTHFTGEAPEDPPTTPSGRPYDRDDVR